MSSRSSVVALGLGSQPGCSTTLPAQRNSFPGLHLLPPRSRSLALLGQDDFKSFSGCVAMGMCVWGVSPSLALCLSQDPYLEWV